MIESLQNFVLGLPEAIQFLGVALAAMVPFVENYGAVNFSGASMKEIPIIRPTQIAGRNSIEARAQRGAWIVLMSIMDSPLHECDGITAR